jgi:nitroreductase
MTRRPSTEAVCRCGATRQVAYALPRRPLGEMRARGDSFRELMSSRRSVRQFSREVVPRDLIEGAIRTAATAPSGANRQPWTFVAIGDPALKREIRIAAEAEERAFYEGGRTPPEWLEALAPLGTDWRKPYLEDAPWLIAVFQHTHQASDGRSVPNYYVKESVGIACGLLIAALHNMGLATLTHTPSPMRFLGRILDRPSRERPYLLMPVGYPAAGATVPDLMRKDESEVIVWRMQSTEAVASPRG